MWNIDEAYDKYRTVDNLCSYCSHMTVLQLIQHLQDELPLI